MRFSERILKILLTDKPYFTKLNSSFHKFIIFIKIYSLTNFLGKMSKCKIKQHVNKQHGHIS